jgi:hypothetical protein
VLTGSLEERAAARESPTLLAVNGWERHAGKCDGLILGGIRAVLFLPAGSRSVPTSGNINRRSGDDHRLFQPVASAPVHRCTSLPPALDEVGGE